MARVATVVQTTEAAERRRLADRRRSLAVVAPSDRQELIGWRTVAKLVGKGRRWIYRRAREGAWGAKRFPWGPAGRGVWKFRRSLVDAWLAQVGRPE